MTQTENREHHPESGNVIFFILLGIILIALVTAAIRSGGGEGANIDRETLITNATRVKQYAQELERAVVFIITNGTSESDILFAHPDAPSDYGNNYNVNPERQVFSPRGGGAEYRTPPAGIQISPADWEFYGNTSPTDVGSAARGDLIALLPDVTLEFCEKINEMDGYDPVTPPDDSGTCINTGAAARFDGGTTYDDATTNTFGGANPMPAAVRPAMDGCIKCADGSYHYFHVLHAR